MLDQGDFASARVLLAESLSLFRSLSDKRGVARSLASMASVMLALAAPERAARLWGAAQSLRESIRMSLPPAERGDYDRRREQTQAVLGEAVFAAAWEEGRTLTWEQVATYAVGEAMMVETAP